MISLIMVSARHNSFKDAKLYIQDIAHRLARSQMLGITGNDVGKWSPIHIRYDDASNQLGYEKIKHLLGTVSNVSERYVKSMLNVSNVSHFTYKELMEIAENNWLATHHPEKLPKKEECSGNNPTILLCRRCSSETTVGTEKKDTTITTTATRKRPASTVFADISNVAKKSKASQTEQFNFCFSKYSSLKTKDRSCLAEKVEIISDLYNKVHVTKSVKLDKVCNVYYFRHRFSVIGKCLNNCFSGDIMQLVDSLPKKKGLYGFKCNVCGS